MILRWFKNFFEKLVLKERSPNVLALSFCLGVLIAFSPFVCFHSVLIIFLSWLFSLNLAVAFAATWLINNPWTMVPVYSMNYVFGDWFLKRFIGLDPLTINPRWMDPINGFICKYTGTSGISFWSFMIGGNLLGIAVSVMLYPIVKVIFKRIAYRVYELKSSHKMENL